MSVARPGRGSKVTVLVAELNVGQHDFYMLLVALRTDQKHIASIGNNAVMHPVDNDKLSFRRQKYIACGIVGYDIGVSVSVVVGILAGILVERAPCPEIAPSEIHTFDIHIVCLFHDREID